MLNKVILLGRLTADPELKQTQRGLSVTSFSVACDRPPDQNGEKQADFFRVVAWRKTAEFICQYFGKGSPIAIDGTLRSRSYTDQEETRRTVVEVLAQQVSFAGNKKESAPEVVAIPLSEAHPAAGQAFSGSFQELDDDGDLPF